MVNRAGKLLATAVCKVLALLLLVSPCVPVTTETEALFIRLKYHYLGYTEHFHFLFHSNSQPITLQQDNCQLKKGGG